MTYPTYTPTLIKGFSAAGAIAAKRFVSHTVTQAGAGVTTIGVAENAVESGEDLPVIVVGTSVIEAGAAIDGTVRGVESDASGRAIPLNTGKLAGVLMPGQTASAAGEFVEILVVQTP